LAIGKGGAIAALSVQLLPHDRDLVGEDRCGRRAGADERVAVPHGTRDRCRRAGAEPQRRVRSLYGFGCDRDVGQLPEPAVEGERRCVGPGRLHQLQPLEEVPDEVLAVDAEGGEVAKAPARGHPHVEAAVAQPVEGGDRPGELHRVVLRTDEHRHAEPEPLGAGSGVGEQLQRRHQRGRADRLLERPRRFETQFLGAGEIGTHPGVVEASGSVLRDRDGEPHDADDNRQAERAGALCSSRGPTART
jgi:hypothetical protein